MKINKLIGELRELVRDWASAAESLELEANTPGGCIRQSPESKLSRAQVLRSNKNQLRDLIERFESQPQPSAASRK